MLLVSIDKMMFRSVMVLPEKKKPGYQKVYLKHQFGKGVSRKIADE
jgi:hypothetical protein